MEKVVLVFGFLPAGIAHHFIGDLNESLARNSADDFGFRLGEAEILISLGKSMFLPPPCRLGIFLLKNRNRLVLGNTETVSVTNCFFVGQHTTLTTAIWES